MFTAERQFDRFRLRNCNGVLVSGGSTTVLSLSLSATNNNPPDQPGLLFANSVQTTARSVCAVCGVLLPAARSCLTQRRNPLRHGQPGGAVRKRQRRRKSHPINRTKPTKGQSTRPNPAATNRSTTYTQTAYRGGPLPTDANAGAFQCSLQYTKRRVA